MAKRTWATQNPEVLIDYIRAYIDATRWCFVAENRPGCLRLLNRHMGLDQARGETTLTALLDTKSGLYPRAELNVRGLAAVVALRAEMGGLALSESPTNEFVDLAYYQKARAD